MDGNDRQQQISSLRKYMYIVTLTGYIGLVGWIQINFPIAFRDFLALQPSWAWWQWVLSLVVNYFVMVILVWIIAPIIIDFVRRKGQDVDNT